jgi:hypothetical protein
MDISTATMTSDNRRGRNAHEINSGFAEVAF